MFVKRISTGWIELTRTSLLLCSLSMGSTHTFRVCATRPMHHYLLVQEWILKQPLGRGLVLKQLMAKEAKMKHRKLKQMLRFNQIYPHRSMIGSNNHFLAWMISRYRLSSNRCMTSTRKILTEVDDALGKFGQSLKGLQSNRMAAMLRDMGDAIANTMDDAREKENDAQHEAQAAEPTVDDAREKEKDAQHESQAAEPTMDEAREKEMVPQHESQAAKPTVVDVHEKEKDAQHEAQAVEPTVDEAREKEKDARHEAQAATPNMDEAREKEKDAQAATTGTGNEAEGAAADIVLNKDQVIGEQEKNQEVATDVGHTHEQQRVSMEVEGDVPPQSPPLFFDAPRSATAGVWDDEPSFELFPKGSEDYELMHGMDEHTNTNKTCTPLYTNIPVFPISDDDGSPTIPADMVVTADEHPIDVSSGPSTHDKNTRKKRMAKVPTVKTKGKKQKVEVKEDKVKALYEKYIKHGKPLRRSKPNDNRHLSSK